MLLPLKGPVSVPFIFATVATAGSPSASGALTEVICSAKNFANRVSRKMRSPMGSEVGVALSFSVLMVGAAPDPDPDCDPDPHPVREKITITGRARDTRSALGPITTFEHPAASSCLDRLR